MKKLMHVKEFFMVYSLQALLFMTYHYWWEELRDTTVLRLPSLHLRETLKIQVPDYSNYNAWQHSTPEVTLHSVIKCTIEKAYKKGENDFDLSMYEIESFIALQYVRRLTYIIFLTLKLTAF